MKKQISILVLGAAILLAGTLAFAENFTVSVNIPAANSATYLVYRITGPSDNQVWTPLTTTDLTFTTTLTDFPNGTSAFLANQFYAVDAFPSGGAGPVNIQINYVDVDKPAGQVDGLGKKGTVSASEVYDVAGVATESPLLSKTSLIGSDGQTLLASTLVHSGFMRVYVGLANGQEAESVGVTPFNPGDKAGDYIGILTLTALKP